MFKTPKTSKRSWTLASATAQLNTLLLVPENMPRTLFTVRGSGTVIDVVDKEGTLVNNYDGTDTLRKKIFNTNYKSVSGMRNPETKYFLQEAVKAERKQDTQRASDFFQAWLNNCTLSFSVLSTKPLFNEIGDGDQVEGNFETIETENGIMVGISAQGLKLKAAAQGKKQNQSVDDILAQFEMVDDSADSDEVEMPTRAEMVKEAKVLNIPTKNVSDLDLFAAINKAKAPATA